MGTDHGELDTQHGKSREPGRASELKSVNSSLQPSEEEPAKTRSRQPNFQLQQLGWFPEWQSVSVCE